MRKSDSFPDAPQNGDKASSKRTPRVPGMQALLQLCNGPIVWTPPHMINHSLDAS